jgi:hypothetical protein
LRHIYAIETVPDHVKVGMAKNVRQRLMAHACLFPNNPLLIGVWKTGSLEKTARLEAKLHNELFVYFKCKGRRELFALPAVCAYQILVGSLGHPMNSQMPLNCLGSKELWGFIKATLPQSYAKILHRKINEFKHENWCERRSRIGLCRSCWEPVVPGKTTCLTHTKPLGEAKC